MVAKQLKRKLLKIKKRTIQALLYISEDCFDFAKSRFFNCFKIVVYFLQLEGYVFSQYESKPLHLSENIYLSNYTQLSPLTFALLQIGNDSLTLFFFYLIFSLHIIIYITLIKMSIDPDISKSNYVKKVLNLFFINYQWMFVTPFQEISVGVMVCGKTAFLHNNQYSSTCYDDKNKLLYIFGVLGTFFVSLSGFSISYFFRSYQFLDKTFSRQFSYLNIYRIILHQLIIILYYVDFSSIDYVKHFCQYSLSLSLIYDNILHQPFGFSFESIFYSSAIFIHQYFLILVSIWIFSPNQSDSFLFLSLVIISPLLVIMAIQIQRKDKISILNNFVVQDYRNQADKYLEEIYRTADESESNLENKILFIQVMNRHTKQCSNVKCNCLKNLQVFLINNQINLMVLNEWTAIHFEQCLSIALINKNFKFYEHLALKYVTFLAKYKNNPINAYAILQSIMNNEQVQNSSQKRKVTQSTSFYFLNIQFILQKRNRNQFQDKMSHYNDQLKFLLQSHSILENINFYLHRQLFHLISIKLKFWEQYINNSIQNFQVLFEKLRFVKHTIEKTSNLLGTLRKKQLKKRIKTYDCVSVLNLELLFKICTTNNIQQILEIQDKINKITIQEQSGVETFLNIHFQNRKGISIVSNITQKKRGELWNPNQSLLQQYFNIDEPIQSLNQLIPPFIQNIHDGLIENFIKNGQSSKFEKSSLIASIYGRNLIQPLQFILGYFFPKFNQEFEFYVIAFVRKIDSMQRSDLSENSKLGFIYFDINLNVLGINEAVAQYLFETQLQVDKTKIDLCQIIPSILGALISYLNLLKNSQKVLEDEIISQKQQETFFVPLETKKNHLINQQKDHISQFQEIQNDVYQTFSNNYFQQIQINYTLFHKKIKYYIGNEIYNTDFYLLKLQFLDDEEKTKQPKETIESPKFFQQIVKKQFQNEVSFFSDDNDDGMYELISQKSRSSNASILQKSNLFQNQLRVKSSKDILILFNIFNSLYSLYLLSLSLIISFILYDKFQLGNNHFETQVNMIRQTANIASLINSINNQNLYFGTDRLNVILENHKNLEITDEDIHNISFEIMLYLSKQLLKDIQQLDIQVEVNIFVKFFNEYQITIEELSISNLIVFNQIMFQSINNYIQQKDLKDLSIIIQNFPVLLDLLKNQTFENFRNLDQTTQVSINLANQLIIFFYSILLISFITQLTLVHKLFQKRKLILKLFIRVDYHEAQLELQKFMLISNYLKNLDGIQILKHLQVVLSSLDLIEFSEDKMNYKQVFQRRVAKIQKPTNRVNSKFTINISHQMTNLLHLLYIIGLTISTFIFIIAFHFQIINSSQSIRFYSQFSQQLYSFQNSHLSSYLNTQCYLIFLISQFNSEELRLIYSQHSIAQNLQTYLDELNVNNYSTILMTYRNLDSQHLLQFSKSQAELIFQGQFCQLNKKICNQMNRNISYTTKLYDYYNRSIDQLLLAQGQVFYQNSEIFYMEKDQSLIYQKLSKMINQQEYILNNFWGFDIIVSRFSESMIYMMELMANQIKISSNQIFFLSMLTGLLYFTISSILLWYFGKLLNKQNNEMIQFLTQVPFSTIQNKNIAEQLKLLI